MLIFQKETQSAKSAIDCSHTKINEIIQQSPKVADCTFLASYGIISFIFEKDRVTTNAMRHYDLFHNSRDKI